MVRGRPLNPHCELWIARCALASPRGGLVQNRVVHAICRQPSFGVMHRPCCAGSPGTLCEQALAGERGGAKHSNAGVAVGGGNQGADRGNWWLLMIIAERLQC